MNKRSFTVLLLVAFCFVALFSCRKSTKSTADVTRNYFPLTFGKYVTYNVDSIIYLASTGPSAPSLRHETRSQMKYVVTDTFTDKKKKLNYVMSVYTRPYDGAYWQANSVIFLQPTANSLLVSMDDNQYVRMMFPVENGFSWPGNQFVETGDAEKAYFKNWNYTYSGMHAAYFNGLVNFENTVTVNEDDESNHYLYVDSQVAASRTYAKEVYALNVGMIYKEWTHWTHAEGDTSRTKNGYTVIMQAIEHN